MGQAFKTVRPGEPLELDADWKNTGNAVFQDYLRRRQGANEPPVPPQNRQTIKVKNTTGAALLRFDIVKLGIPVFNPTDSLDEFKRMRPVFETAVPQPLQPFAALVEPLAVNQVGDAILEGLAVCKVAFTHDKMPFADGDATVAELEGSGDGYARVLWKETGTGLKWAVLQLGAGPRGYFPVTLVQTGGANGTKTTAASWTYTVNCVGWDGSLCQLATAKAPARLRPFGTRVAAQYGQAYYVGISLNLWDTDERPGTAGCT